MQGQSPPYSEKQQYGNQPPYNPQYAPNQFPQGTQQQPVVVQVRNKLFHSIMTI